LAGFSRLAVVGHRNEAGNSIFFLVPSSDGEQEMRAQIMRLFAVVAVAAVPLVFFTLPGLASANERDLAGLRTGIFHGIWHTDKVQIIIEKVHRDGTFTGQVHFERDSRFPDYRFEFSAKLSGNNSLTMTRLTENCNQVAQTTEPRREGRAMVWHGGVTGPGLGDPEDFELRIPLGR
jgi:hypothetical protein